MLEKNYTSSQERAFINSSDLEGYKKFAFKDDMLKLSVCFIIGNSFNKVVCGISDYLVMPITTYLISSTGTQWRELTVTPLRGMDIELGRLAGVFVDFFMVSIILYLIYIKLIGRLLRRNSEPIQKRCPNCMSMIHVDAKTCPMCKEGLIVEKRRTGSKNKGTKNA